MGHFKNVFVNAGNNTMTIGGATTFNEIVDPLYAACKETGVSILTISALDVVWLMMLAQSRVPVSIWEWLAPLLMGVLADFKACTA